MLDNSAKIYGARTKILFFCMVLLQCISLASFQSYKEYKISSKYGWNVEKKKCAMGGDDSIEYKFEVGNWKSLGLTYESLKTSKVKLYGTFELYVRVNGWTSDNEFSTYNYGVKNNRILHSGLMSDSGSFFFGSQQTKIKVRVYFYENGNIELENYAYAGSWKSVSCAIARSSVSTIRILAVPPVPTTTTSTTTFEPPAPEAF